MFFIPKNKSLFTSSVLGFPQISVANRCCILQIFFRVFLNYALKCAKYAPRNCLMSYYIFLNLQLEFF